MYLPAFDWIRVPAPIVSRLQPAQAWNRFREFAPQSLVTDSGKIELPEIGSVQLVGACELAIPNLSPWGMDGRPLSAANQTWFWYGAGAKLNANGLPNQPIKTYDDRSFTIVFRTKSDVFAYPSKGEIERLSVSKQISTGHDPILGFNDYVFSYQFKPTLTSTEISIDFIPKSSTDIISIDPKSRKYPDGFQFEFRERTIKAFVATQKRTTHPKVKAYLVIATVPPELAKLELELRTNDPTKRQTGDLDGFLLAGKAIPAEEYDPSLKGKVVFMIQAPDTPGFERKFILSVRKSYRVTFKGIPTAPGHA